MQQVMAPGGIRSEVSYDRDEVDRFTAEVAAEQARIQAEIEVVRAQVRAVRGAAADRLARSHAELAGLVVAAQAELARRDREHEEARAAVVAAAEAEATRLLEAARAEAAAVRQAAADLARLVRDGSAPELGPAGTRSLGPGDGAEDPGQDVAHGPDEDEDDDEEGTALLPPVAVPPADDDIRGRRPVDRRRGSMSDEHRPAVAEGGAGEVVPRVTVTPAPVVDGDEVGQVVRTARAGIALLGLQLRTARAELEEARAGGADRDDPGSTRELLRASLDGYAAAREAERAAELDAVGRQAVQVVRQAQAEAAALVAGAHDEAGALLAAAAGEDVAAAPVLQVVRPGRDQDPPAGAAGPGEVLAPDPPAGATAEPAASSAPAAPADTGGLPTDDDELWERLGLAEARVDDRWARSWDGAVAAPSGVVALGPTRSRTRPAWARFLYADVILPMVAVVIIFVVLLAWVG